MPVVINRSLFAFSKIGAKSVTTALGGSVRFVKIDDKDTDNDPFRDVFIGIFDLTPDKTYGDPALVSPGWSAG